MAGINLLSMMAGGGMPSFPCAICRVKLYRQVRDLPPRDAPEPMPATTMVQGTPVCDVHASRLVHGLEAAVSIAYLTAYPTAQDVPE